MNRVLIAGYGYLGQALAECLTEQGGCSIYALRRNWEDGALPIAGPLHPISADLGDPRSLELADLPSQVDAIFYVASSGGSRDPEDWQRIFSDGPVNLATRVRADRFVLASSTLVYGEQTGAWVDEETPPAPPNRKAELIGEGERRLLACRPAGAVVVARLSGIYGAGRARLLKRALSGEPCPDPFHSAWLNQIHREDAAAALLHLAGLPDPAALYLLSDGVPTLRRDVMDGLCAASGRPPLPPGGEDPSLRSGRGNRRVCSERLLASGYEFRYPTWREGYAQILSSS